MQGSKVSFRLVRDYLVYLVVRVFVCIVQTLRLETCQAVAHGLAVLAYDVLRIRRQVVDDNLRHAFNDWSAQRRSQIARGMWEHLVLMVCEIAHLQRKIHDTNWHKHMTLANCEVQIQCLLRPRAAILLTGHFGNFEAAGFLSGIFGYPTFTIARPLDNPFLDRFVKDFRGATGQQMLPKEGVAARVADLLAGGGKLALLGDQFGGPRGCWVEFFGRPASYHKAIGLFSLTSGAPLIVTYAKRTRRPLHFELGVLGVYDPAEPNDEIRGAKDLIQWYNDLLEQLIRTAPEQYWWLHRRWKDPRKSA